MIVGRKPISPAAPFARSSQPGDPLLAAICSPINPDDADLAGEMADLATTLPSFREETGVGRGITAPQIGVTKRLTIIDLGEGPIALVNPEITWRSDETQWVWNRLWPDMAELLQREIDHLDGILMTDHSYGPEGIAPMSARAELVDKYRRAPGTNASGMKLV